MQRKTDKWSSREWNETHLDRISVYVPKGLKSRIQAHAERIGETVNGMIGRLLRRELGMSEDEWTEGKRSE